MVTRGSEGMRALDAAGALLDVPTEGSVADPLVRFFRMRELRGAKR